MCVSASDPGSLIPVGSGPCAPGNALLVPEQIVGIQRRDHIFRGRAGLGFQFSRTASVQLAYEYQDRRSNMESFGYLTERWILGFRFGWSPDREFI